MTPSSTQLAFLSKLAKNSLVGPSPEYQGDCQHISGPELNDLIQAKMVGRRKLPHVRDGEVHYEKPPYLKITHRYLILKRGRAALISPASRGDAA